MALFVKDAQVDALVEQLASVWRTNKTDAVRRALQTAIASERSKADLVEQTVVFVRSLHERTGPRSRPVDEPGTDGPSEAE